MTRSAVLGWLARTRGPVDPRDIRSGMIAEHPAIDRVRREVYDAFGINPRLVFLWSHTGSGVEDDAPAVIHLHRLLLLAVKVPADIRTGAERLAALDMSSVIRHEIGHALLGIRSRATRTTQFKQLFGDIKKPYRVRTVVEEVRDRLAAGGFANPKFRDFVSLYAASHPLEAWAEAVRIAIGARGDTRAIAAWCRRFDASDKVHAQVAYAAAWLRSYSGPSAPTLPRVGRRYPDSTLRAPRPA